MTETPSRKITNTKNSKKIGCFPSKKNGRIIRFESLIERDYIYLLEFDSTILSYIEQPFKIKYTYNNKKHSYTPDFKVIREKTTQLIEAKPFLKYKSILNDQTERKKYDAAFNYCNYKNFEFKVVTDKDIRAGYLLKNIKYLFMYSTIEVPENEKEYIISKLSSCIPISINKLLDILTDNNSLRSYYQRYIFSLIYSHHISLNLANPISLKSHIFIGLR